MPFVASLCHAPLCVPCRASACQSVCVLTMKNTPCPSQAIPSHAMPCRLMPCHAMLCHVVQSNAHARHDAAICTCLAASFPTPTCCRGAGRRRQHHRCHRRWACTGVRRRACHSLGLRMLPRRFMLANMWHMAGHLAPQHMHLPSLIHAGRPAALRTAGCGAVTPVSALPVPAPATCDHASRP